MAPAMEARDLHPELLAEGRELCRRLAHGEDVRAWRVHFGDWLADVRRIAPQSPRTVVESLVDVLEQLPPLLSRSDAGMGAGDALIDLAALALVDTMLEEEGSGAAPIDRVAIIERLFHLWTEDESGLLGSLDEAMIELLTTAELEDRAIAIARRHLRSIPLPFVKRGARPTGGQLIDIADRFKVENFVGQILARRDRFDYAVLAGRTYHRLTGDAVDYISALARAGMITDALDIGRRALRDPATPRVAALKETYDHLVGQKSGLGDEAVITRRLRAFIGDPTIEHFDSLKDACPIARWPRIIDAALGHLERTNTAPELTFRLYLREGRIVEADGMVVNRFLDPDALATGAQSILESHPDRAAGWLLIAAYHLMRVESSEQAYRRAAEWLSIVRRAAHATAQAESFLRAIAQFKARYGRRRALLRTLTAFGL